MPILGSAEDSLDGELIIFFPSSIRIIVDLGLLDERRNAASSVLASCCSAARIFAIMSREDGRLSHEASDALIAASKAGVWRELGPNNIASA